MGTPQTSSLVSIMLSFTDDPSQARQLFNQLAQSEDQRVTVPFGDWMFGSQMGQVVDKYGITWLITTDYDLPEQ
jgi:PhnB protein